MCNNLAACTVPRLIPSSWISTPIASKKHSALWYPVDNFGTVEGENPSCYGILPLWAVNELSIVCWVQVILIMNLMEVILELEFSFQPSLQGAVEGEMSVFSSLESVPGDLV